MGKFLIVGTGRSGTTYCKAILQICGIRTGHQEVFTWDTVKTGEWDWGEFAGEASFMAVPLLEKIKEREPNTTIVTVTRNIKAVESSWSKRGVFEPGWEKFYPDFYDALRLYARQSDRPSDQLFAYQDYAISMSDYVLDIENLTRNPYLLFTAVGRMYRYDESMVNLVATNANTDG